MQATGRRRLRGTQTVAVSSCEVVVHQAVDDPVDARRHPHQHHPDKVDLVRQRAFCVQSVDHGDWQVAGREGQEDADDGLQ